MLRKLLNVFAVLSMFLVSTFASSAEQVQCVHLDQDDCFTIRFHLVKFDPLNELHKGLSDQETGRKYFEEHLKDVIRYLGSPESVSPSSQDVYFVLWTNQDVDDANLAAYTFSSKNRSKVSVFENVTDSVDVDEALYGKPTAVYRVRSSNPDGRGLALVIPKRYVEPKEMRVLMYLGENMAYPPKIVIKKEGVKKDWPPGFSFDSNLVKKTVTEKNNGLNFLGLVIE